MESNLFQYEEPYESKTRGKLRPIMYKENKEGCHEVVSHKGDRDGYIRLCRRVGGVKKILLLHRIVYEDNYGKIPEGLVVRHTCDNPSCINPKHLLIGTVQDNTNDKISRNRHCIGEKNGRTKLTEKEVLAIRNDTRLARIVAKDYGITTTHVYYLRNKDNWKHI